MSCSSSCPTQNHESFGACLRAKNLHVGYCQDWKGHDATRQKKWDAELQAYRDARALGVQPSGTKMRNVRDALEISAKLGVPYDASAPLPLSEGT